MLMMARVVRVVTIVRVVGAVTVRVVNLHIGLECNQCSSFFEEKTTRDGEATLPTLFTLLTMKELFSLRTAQMVKMVREIKMVRVVHMVRVVNLHMVPEGNQFKTIRDGVALPYLVLTLLTHCT